MEFVKIIIITTVIFTLFLICSKPAVAGEKIQGKRESDIPLHKGMWFIDYITLKNSITAARYCSSSPVAAILKFYKNIFKNAVEIQEGSSKGKVYKLLLDVSSPVRWRDSKRFIEIYSDTKKAECSTIIHIAGVLKAPKEPEKMKEAPRVTAPPEERKPKKLAEEIPSRRKYIGIGAFANALNFSAGPTLILWPLENLAVQAYYGVGTFTAYEARVFYRFNISSRLNPYLGAGYIHAEREANVIGIDTKIKGDSFSVFGGVELPIYKGLFAYVEASGTPMKLEKEVTNGTRTVKAIVDYNSVTIGTGLIFYLW